MQVLTSRMCALLCTYSVSKAIEVSKATRQTPAACLSAAFVKPMSFCMPFNPPAYSADWLSFDPFAPIMCTRHCPDAAAAAAAAADIQM